MGTIVVVVVASSYIDSMTIGSESSNAVLLIESQLRLSFFIVQFDCGVADGVVVAQILRGRSLDSALASAPHFERELFTCFIVL